ncbi:hypothetical protein [Mycobacterium sp. OTB74]|jgi:hypothetical protein|uniref:hypothetical protein n=1 Tax=Mycobacterium sp. OTB74 TaxID=1853452 RepID=UPI0024751062|nr:hypothetical protein [Mycobacterium sp. OTB74]MDH6243772.1 hypothetical protein [Mycobacterium sp. OTB74]
MTQHDERAQTPDAERLARSMLQLLGHAEDDGVHDHVVSDTPTSGSWSKAPDFASEPARAAAVHAATEADRTRYLTAGLAPVSCRFCHGTVSVKKLGPEHTAVQWNSSAMDRCAYFGEIRASGGDPSRSRSCPRMSDSIKHAVAEGCLEEFSSTPSPGDG